MSSSAPPPSPSCDSGFAPWKLLPLLGLFIVMAFPGVVFGTHSFFYRDYGIFGYPLAQYHRESFWRGEIPFWNPLSNCGLPFLAQWNSLVFYPGSLIYLFLPLPWSLNVFCLAHLFLGAWGMYSLAHRWTGNRFAASVAGFAFSWNGLTLHSLMWPNNIAALGWMPWVVLMIERAWREGGRQIVLAALIGAIQMLSGAAEIILLTWVIVAVFWVAGVLPRDAARLRMALRFGTCGILIAAIAAVQLFPFFDLLVHSHRDASFANSAWSMPLWGFANFFVPLFGCTPSVIGVYSQDSQQWTSSYYMGIGVLAFAVLGLRERSAQTRILASLAAIGLIFSLGQAGLVYALVKKVLPILGFIRFPIKYAVLVVFTMPLLAAFGVAWLQNNTQEPTSKRKSVVRLGTVFVMVVALLILVSYFIKIERSSPVTTMESGVTRIIFFLLALAGILKGGQQASATKRSLLLSGVLVIIGLDALTHTPRQNPTVPNTAYSPAPLPMSSVPAVGESRAMISPRMRLTMHNAVTSDPVELYAGFRRASFGNCNLIDHVPKVDGFYSLYLREAEEVNSRIYLKPEAPKPLMDFLGVSQESDPETLFVWHARTNFLPLITAGQQPIISSSAAALEAICSPQFDPRNQVYLSPEAESATEGMNRTDAKIISSRVEPQRIIAEVDAPAPTMVVVAQAFYHPWKAFVDNHSVPLWKANYAFQAVPIPSGRHQLRIQYSDTCFRAGALISILAVAGCGVSLFVLRRKKGNGASIPIGR